MVPNSEGSRGPCGPPASLGGAASPYVPRAECYRCFKPQVACVCATIETVDNQTGLIVLQHPRERLHALGTTRIVRLGLRHARVVPLTQWTPPTTVVLPPRAALLYPSRQSRDLRTLTSAERPEHLVVLDGTWFHARKMFAAHAWLHDVPHVRIEPDGPSRYGDTRAEPKVGYVATLEAIVYALRILEPATVGLDRLLYAFSAMVARQAAYTPAAREARL